MVNAGRVADRDSDLIINLYAGAVLHRYEAAARALRMAALISAPRIKIAAMI